MAMMLIPSRPSAENVRPATPGNAVHVFANDRNDGDPGIG